LRISDRIAGGGLGNDYGVTIIKKTEEPPQDPRINLNVLAGEIVQKINLKLSQLEGYLQREGDHEG
jgi:hypothetical protein